MQSKKDIGNNLTKLGKDCNKIRAIKTIQLSKIKKRKTNLKINAIDNK